jgi:hypothetical protein
MYSLNRSINMISLFLGTNQLALYLVKTHVSMARLQLHSPRFLARTHNPMSGKNPLGIQCSLNFSTCLVAFKIASSISHPYHRSHQTTCNAISAAALLPTEARSGNTRSATSSHGNALTHPVPKPSHYPKIWYATSVQFTQKERNHVTTATATRANTVAVGRKMVFRVKTTVFGTCEPAKNEFEIINHPNHIDHAA